MCSFVLIGKQSLEALLAGEAVRYSDVVTLNSATKDLIVVCAKDVQRLVCDCRADLAVAIQRIVKQHHTAAALVAQIVTERAEMKRGRQGMREQEVAKKQRALAQAAREANMLKVTQIQREVDELTLQGEADRSELTHLQLGINMLQSDIAGTVCSVCFSFCPLVLMFWSVCHSVYAS